MPAFPSRLVLGSSLDPKIIDERQKYAPPNRHRATFSSLLDFLTAHTSPHTHTRTRHDIDRLLDRYLKELLVKKRLWNSFHIKLFFNLYDLTGKVAVRAHRGSTFWPLRSFLGSLYSALPIVVARGCRLSRAPRRAWASTPRSRWRA
jgi:hypothetical protein